MKRFENLKESIGGVLDGLRLPELPTLGREVELPVYIIHNSGDPEDYFFIFDFEAFVEQSLQGVWVRPKLRLWAGRSDFERRIFARQFRESFAREFELARQELAAQPEAKAGWFSGMTEFFRCIAAPSIGGLLSNLVLAVALSAGTKVLGQVLPAAWTRKKTDKDILEDGIKETRDKVDAALTQIEITLHMELYRHAYRGLPPGKLTGMDYDAWPLPAYVREHLADGVSGAWW